MPWKPTNRCAVFVLPHPLLRNISQKYTRGIVNIATGTWRKECCFLENKNKKKILEFLTLSLFYFDVHNQSKDTNETEVHQPVNFNGFSLRQMEHLFNCCSSIIVNKEIENNEDKQTHLIINLPFSACSCGELLICISEEGSLWVGMQNKLAFWTSSLMNLVQTGKSAGQQWEVCLLQMLFVCCMFQMLTV